ncbi:MAG: hypothetical protein KBT27_14680 [Prevotellaceae bacterium]|nr:hypothetical protein [Candidatus Faecinaster equi]
MKTKLLLLSIAAVLFAACEKKNSNSEVSAVPTVVTGQVSIDATTNSVQCEGYVTSDGGSKVIDRGICYMKGDGTPTLADNHVSGGDGIGPYNCKLEKLDVSKYSYCAYAVNSVGTSYGEVRSFSVENSGLPKSYIKSGDKITTLESSNCLIYYNYAIQPAFCSDRIVRFYSDKGDLSFFIVTRTTAQLTTIDSGTWTYTSTWSSSPTVYIEYNLFGTEYYTAMTSFRVKKSGGNYIIDAVINSTTTMHYEGDISVSFIYN